MLKQIAILAAILLSLTALSQDLNPKPKKMTTTKKVFVADGDVVVIGDNQASSSAAEISRWLNSEGVNSVYGGNVMSMFKQRIVLKIGTHGGRGESYSIVINAKKVEITASSTMMLQRAADILKQLIISVQYKGRVCKGFRGGEIADWGDAAKKTKGDMVFDAATRHVSTDELDGTIKRWSGGGTRIIYFKMVDQSGWLAPSDIFNQLQLDAIGTGRAYTYEEIKHISDACARHGVEFIPTFCVLDNIPRFAESTGHEVMSVEGLRFIKAMIKDYVDHTGVNKVCLGKAGENMPIRYINDLSEYLKTLDVESIIWE